MTRIIRQTVARFALPFSLICFSPVPGAAREPPMSEPPATQPAEPAPSAPAPEAPSAPAPEMPAPAPVPAAPTDLPKTVDDYWHYGKIARYDLAVYEAQKILASGAEPLEVLKAFEAVTAERKDNLDEWLLRWQAIEPMADVTGQIVKVLNHGRYARRSDPTYIKNNIERLVTNERAYILAIGQLRDSGELAVPFMIDYLRDPSKAQYHAAIRRGLRDLGRYALNPLVASTEMKDAATLVAVETALGELGYDVAVPYLARLASMPDATPAVKGAASAAIQRIIGVDSGTLKAGEQFYALGEKFYYDTAAITSDSRNPVAYMWYWSDDKGLTKLDVPQSIFNELMAMRSAEYALKLGPTQGDALSLWLAANYEREVELPAGEEDPTRAENQPDANYYGVAAGSQYLNAALARALKDRSSPLAMKIIASLQEIAGQSNALPGGTGPLVTAMSYPDRLVRFEAAFALAGSLPQQSFDGQDRVVPLLAEALSQTGQPSVLLVMPDTGSLNKLSEDLKGAGFLVAGGTSAASAATAANELPAVDVILISDDLTASEIESVFATALSTAKLTGAARLVMVRTQASPFEQRKNTDPLLGTTLAVDAAGLKPAIEGARARAGALPVDPAVATAYATRAGQLLAQLAISRGQVLNLSPAKPTLLSSLNDARPDIVKLSGYVLGLLPDKDAQAGLLTGAMSDKNSDEVKVSLYNSLATNAKFFGNMLDTQQIEALTKVVADAQNLQVRSAAAQAHGALNLPSDQAKTLIVNQSKV
ncbi:MAG: HEAT repeat domain-containing protein [Tepidisphaeraceae bacterium]